MLEEAEVHQIFYNLILYRILYLILCLYLHLTCHQDSRTDLIINTIKFKFFVFIIGNRWIQASSAFEIEHSLITSAQSTKLIIHTVSTTIAKDKLNPTPLQQTPPGCVQEVNVGPWLTSLITNLVFAKFTLSPLMFIQSFHAAYLTSACFKLPAIITKSSTYNIF